MVLSADYGSKFGALQGNCDVSVLKVARNENYVALNNTCLFITGRQKAVGYMIWKL